MPRTRDNYQIQGSTPQDILAQLNFVLQRISDRLDKIEGIRGTASIESTLVMNENTIEQVAAGTADDDAARRDEMAEQIATHVAESNPHTQYARKASAETISAAWVHTADLEIAEAELRVTDSDDATIHSFGA